LKIAICDDLESDRQAIIHMIKKYCKDYNVELELYDYENGHKLLSDFKHEKFKLIFLDIYMNDINGIEIAKEIRLHDSDILIIFMTTSRDHALDAFEVDAMQYLVKPVDYEKLHNIFNKCQKLFTDNMRFIKVPSNGLSVKIFLKDIYYIEVYNKTSLIHTSLQTIKTYTPLNKLWELLGENPFLRCHRSYIVNMFYIDDILENDFLLKNGDKIPIRREAYSDIKQIYSDYFFEKMRNDI
jgi:DNA-binding LytR/AlgR family response regulator